MMNIFAGHLPRTMQLRLAVVVAVAAVAGYSADSARDRGHKTQGVNGGSVFFDTRSGEWTRRRDPAAASSAASVTVIRRTPVRTLGNGGVVNKVLKRRKKYRRLPQRRADSGRHLGGGEEAGGESEDRAEARHAAHSFEQLEPLEAKYKTSDSIRMHIRKGDKDSGRQQEKPSNLITKADIRRAKHRQEPRKGHIELSDKFKFKQKVSRLQHSEQVAAESRERRTWEVPGAEAGQLLASAYHASLSVQEPSHNSVGPLQPAYDYTIGTNYSQS